MTIVTIIDYSQNRIKECKMSYINIDLLLKQKNLKNIFVLYNKHYPKHIEKFNDKRIKIFQRPCDSKAPNAHFNVKFKMFNLMNIKQDFIYLDSDTFVIGDLNYLWERRKYKPFIAINHQKFPKARDTMRSPFIQGGVQIFSDCNFFDYRKIVKKPKVYKCPGAEQLYLYNWFKTINYDYTHPEIGTEWNSCSYLANISYDNENNKWVGHTKGLPSGDHPIYVNHYWAGFKPWNVKCPIFNSYNI